MNTQPPAAAAAPVAAASHAVARLIPLDPGFYAFNLSAGSAGGAPLVGLALPAVHISAPPGDGPGIEISDSFGRTESWLGGPHRTLFVKAPTAGGGVLVTAYLARDPDASVLELEVHRLASQGVVGAITAPLLTLKLNDPDADTTTQRVRLDAVAHIRARGNVRFVDTPWVGRLGPGLWIEAFAITPQDAELAETFEYKGLIANGTETPWLDAGTACGTTGRGMPLIGFAVRQKAGNRDLRLDCEYTGYFRSGTVSNPARNGAPCRSREDSDPLEGLQLRITRRPPPPTSRDAD